MDKQGDIRETKKVDCIMPYTIWYLMKLSLETAIDDKATIKTSSK